MKKKMNNLSIIIPYYKGQDYIYRCINSLLKSYKLSQKEMLFEIIVVVDSPEEYKSNNLDIASHYEKSDPIQVLINKQNLGVAASRNRGLKSCKYDFVTFIDQDDQVLSDYFPILEKNLDNNHFCFIYNGYWHYTDKETYFKLYFIKPDLRFTPVVKEHFTLWTPGLMIINKKKIPMSDYFLDVCDQYKGCDDWAALLNILLKYPQIGFKYIAQPLFIFNRHSESFSNNVEQMYQCRIAVLEYFRDKVDLRKNKIINRLIAIRNFQIKKDLTPLTKKELVLKYKTIYLQYIWNKWGYWNYPELKLRKTLHKVSSKLKLFINH